jgi:outer membrane protein OmpA-like peptidoglycan-associated protein
MAGASQLDGRFDRRVWTGIAALTKGMAILVAGATLMHTPLGHAQDGPLLRVAVGKPGSASHQIGRGVASLLRTMALADGTKVQAEVWESLPPVERVFALREDVQLAVVPADDEALEHPRAQKELRAAVVLADGNQILVIAKLDDALVYQTTQMIFENAGLLREYYDEIGALEPSASLERMSLAVHPGAMRYYREQGQERSDLADREDLSVQALPDPESFMVYFGFNEASLDSIQVSTVAEACRYAATLPSAEFVLGGHTDTFGPNWYNDRLSLSRAESVAAAIRSDSRFRDATNVISFGEQQLAVQTADEVREPDNRRVVITVVPGKLK